jgi:hypothetical protein
VSENETSRRILHWSFYAALRAGEIRRRGPLKALKNLEGFSTRKKKLRAPEILRNFRAAH